MIESDQLGIPYGAWAYKQSVTVGAFVIISLIGYNRVNIQCDDPNGYSCGGLWLMGLKAEIDRCVCSSL